MPYSTWRDDSGDEWQQVLSLNSVASEAGPLVPAAQNPGPAEKDQSTKTSELGNAQPESFLCL